MAAIDVISLVDEGLDNSRTCLTSAMARRWLHTRTSICGRALQRSDAGYGSPTPRTPTCTPTSSSAGSGWVAAWPTHGAGSFCSAPPGAERTSTIGATLATNTPIDAESEDALGSFPPYFLRLGEFNRRGPAPVWWGHPATAVGRRCGLGSWIDARMPTRSIPLVSAESLEATSVLDIRQDSEFTAGHVPGTAHVELGDLATSTAAVPSRPTVVMCGQGERAMGAASLLARTGRELAVLLDGGPTDRAKATGRTLERSA